MQVANWLGIAGGIGGIAAGLFAGVQLVLYFTDPIDRIERYISTDPDYRMALASTLQGIICQRLIPRAFGKGRVPAIEILINNATIAKLMMDDKIDRMSQAIEGMRNEGMQSFNQALYDLVNEGEVTEDVALEAASNPEALKMMFEGIFLNTEGSILGN